MTKELELALSQIIDKSLMAVDTATVFLSNQLPDVLSQLLLFHLVWNWSCVVCGATTVAISVYYAIKFFKAADVTNLYGAYAALMFCPIMVGFIIFAEHTRTAILITLAPKIWLMEYASTLIKG